MEGYSKILICTKKIGSGKLNFPSPVPLPGKNVNIPFVILADEAFALTNNIII